MLRFSFTDLVVAALLICLAVGVFLPAAINKKEEANRVECQAHLSLIGRALLLYSNENKGLFPRTRAEKYEKGKETLKFFTNPNVAKIADTDPFDGQNVFYADGHAEFQRTPLCGATRDKRKVMDNIYTYGVNTLDIGGDGIVGDPADAVDSVLLPSAVECLAAMPKDE